MKGKLGNICICLGLLFLITALFLSGHNIYMSMQSNKAVGKVTEKLYVKMPPVQDSMLQLENVVKKMPTIDIEGYAYIGMLEVPHLNLSLPIMEVCDEERLKIAPCRYAGSFYSDDCVIAGHNIFRHFRELKKLPIDSEILFTDVEGNCYRYYVGWFETIEASAIDKMTQKSEEESWDLTLFTCTSDGRSRCAIRCIKK